MDGKCSLIQILFSITHHLISEPTNKIPTIFASKNKRSGKIKEFQLLEGLENLSRKEMACNI